MSRIALSTGETPDTEYTVADYWTAVYRRRWLILLLVVLCVVTIRIVGRTLPTVYEASVVFYVPHDVNGSAGIGRHLIGARLPSGTQDHARAYALLLRQSDAWNAARRHVPEKPLSQFRRDVDVVTTKRGAIRIYSRDEDPTVAARVANSLVAYFDEFHLGLIREDVERSLAALAVQIEEIEQRLRDTLVVRQAFQEEHSIALIGRNTELLESERQQFTSRLLEARIVQASIERELESLDEQIRAESERYVRGQLLETRAGAFHTELRQRKALLQVDLSGARARIDGLDRAIATLDATIRDTPAFVAELRAMDDDLAGYRQTRRNLERLRDDLRARTLNLRSAAVVIRSASPPRTPKLPKTALNTGAAAVAGLLIGTICALLLDARQRRRPVAT